MRPLHRHLGGEGAFADPGRVGLEDDDDIVDPGRADAVVGGDLRGGSIFARHVGVGPEVERDPEALGPLEEDRLTLIQGAIDVLGHIGDEISQFRDVFCLPGRAEDTVGVRRTAPGPGAPDLLPEVLAPLIPGDMILFDDTAPPVDKGPVPGTEQVDLTQKDPGIDEHAAPDHEGRFRVDEPRGNHPDPVRLLSDTNGVSCVRTDAAPGDDGWSVLVSDMGHYLSLSFVTKEPADDNSTTHCSIM